MSPRFDLSKANSVDLLVAALLALLVWPFPIMRSLLPVPAHVLAILAWIVAVAEIYAQVAVWRWRRTLGMYFYDLALPDSASVWARGKWAAVWIAVAVPGLAWPSLLRDGGLPGKASGLVPVHTEPRKR